MARSSSRTRWAKAWLQTLAPSSVALTNMPASTIGWATPRLRRKVDLPPELALDRRATGWRICAPTSRIPGAVRCSTR